MCVCMCPMSTSSLLGDDALGTLKVVLLAAN